MKSLKQIITRRRIERERDIDLLTGIYNRRAMERELSRVFSSEMGVGALVLIDSDALKSINDLHGHTVGDQYIKHIADAISGIGSYQRMAARLGGDEFVLLLYGYPNETELRRDLDTLRYLQDHSILLLEDGQQLPVLFSFGYVLTAGHTDYSTLLSEADKNMYDVKRQRKLHRKEKSTV